MKFLLSLAVAILLSTAAFAEGAASWVPDAGLVFNGGGGTNGATAQGGATAYFDAITTNVQLEAAAGSLSLSADYLPWSGPLGSNPNLTWTAGPGVYFAGALGDDTAAWAVGLRAVAGLEYLFAPKWQLFTNVVPALGVNWSRSETKLLWNADLEIGFRYLFSKGVE